MDTVYSSLCSQDLFCFYHQLIPQCFFVEGVPSGEGWHQLSLRLCCSGNVLPVPSAPVCSLLCAEQGPLCPLALRGLCGCPGLQVRAHLSQALSFCLATPAFTGLMPACPCELCYLWSPCSTPAEKPSLCGWIWAANCCRLGVWGKTWTQLFTQHELGVHCLLSSVGHLSLQLCPVCGLVSALDSCGGLRHEALCSGWQPLQRPILPVHSFFSFSHHFLLFAKSIKGIQHITVIFNFILCNNSQRLAQTLL